MKEGCNVVFFMCDQMSARALSMWDPNNTNVPMPNIERLAREGVTFMNAVCVVPFSSPSRASFVTGMYPNTHGILTNINDDVEPLDPSIPTTEGELYKRGYTTGFFGKWHLGKLNNWECYRNSDGGWMDFKGYAELRKSKKHTAKPPRKNEVLARPNYDQGYGFYMDKYLYEKMQTAPNAQIREKLMEVGRYGVPVELDNWTLCNEDGIAFIRANKDRPFMATISLHPPHLPFAVQEPYFSRMQPEDVWFPPSAYDTELSDIFYNQLLISRHVGERGVRLRMRSYYTAMLYIDDMLGRVLKALDDLKLADNTLLIFTSDHGDPIASHGMMFDKLLKNFIEELTVTPTFMRLPGVIPAGLKVQAQFNSPDFAPTILDYLGCEIPSTMQGRSFRPIMEGREKDEVGFSIQMRPYARQIRGEIDGKLYTYAKVFTVRQNRVLSEELYNVTDDFYQQKNQIDNPEYKAIKERLIAEFNQFADRYGDRRMEELPSKGLLTTGNLTPALMR